MKNHRFPWLRNRTTDNRKCEKARNIKEKRTIEMFNTVSKLLVVHHSSPNDNLERSDNERKRSLFRVQFVELMQKFIKTSENIDFPRFFMPGI